MLELIFLGTGSAIPNTIRNPSSIWLGYEGEFFLWDCGEGTQKQLMKAKASFMKIDRIFITHWHADHWAGLIGLMQTMNLEGRRKPLYIYGPEAERFVYDLLDLDYWGPRFKVIAKNIPYEGSTITKVYESDLFEIISIPVEHTVPAISYAFIEKDKINLDIKKAEKIYGIKQGPVAGKLKEKGEVVFKGKKIRLKDVGIVKKGLKVAYTGDTKATPNLVKIGKGADILIHDATFEAEKENRMHSGAKEAGNTAKKAGVKKLILTHFSRRYVSTKPLVEEAQKVFKNTEAAKDLMKIKLKRE